MPGHLGQATGLLAADQAVGGCPMAGHLDQVAELQAAEQAMGGCPMPGLRLELMAPSQLCRAE